MWENYFKLRSSDSFKTSWKSLLQRTIGLSACPVFYQFVTDELMEVLIKEKFVPPCGTADMSTLETYLDSEESNALLYTAGYVIHKLVKEIKHTSPHNQKELLLCLQEMGQG